MPRRTARGEPLLRVPPCPSGSAGRRSAHAGETVRRPVYPSRSAATHRGSCGGVVHGQGPAGREVPDPGVRLGLPQPGVLGLRHRSQATDEEHVAPAERATDGVEALVHPETTTDRHGQWLVVPSPDLAGLQQVVDGQDAAGVHRDDDAVPPPPRRPC